MTRIPAVTPSEASPLIKVAYKFAARQYDEVPEPFAVPGQPSEIVRSGCPPRNGCAEGVEGAAVEHS